MKRLRRSVGIGAALSFLLLGAPVDGAGADTPVQEAPAPQAEQASARRPAPEPTGRRASIAALRSGRLNCGDVITQTTTLTADVGPCAGSGIIIGADNIMLNLNGHTISGTPGPGDGNAAGIRLPFRTGVRITGQPGNSGRTGTITGFDAGVFVNGGSGNTIENLVVSDNIGPRAAQEPLLADGIVLFHSAANQILNNLVTHNGPYDGIGVLGVDSNDNLLQGNTVEKTVGGVSDGLFDDSLGGEGTGIILNNFLDEFDSPRRGTPIFNNHVLNNIVRQNNNSGISNVTHVGGRIEGNIVQDNGVRGEICERQRQRDGSEGPLVCRPVVEPSNGIGVIVGPRTTRFTRMLIANNRVTGNAGDGIAIGGPNIIGGAFENQIIGNVATGNGSSVDVVTLPNGRYDLHDFNFDPTTLRPACDNNVWVDNVFETAYPVCATGGLGSPEIFGDASCSDGLDNDLDGGIDAGDGDCSPPVRRPPPGGERPPPGDGGSL